VEEVIPHPVERVFNSPLETGVRALIVLNALYPATLDLNDLLLFDHLVVHTADFGGPPSLHPDLPPRAGEPLVRRRLIESGIALMRMRHLIEVEFASGGIFYRASEDASSMIELMRSTYARNLVIRARWLADQYDESGSEGLRRVVSERLGLWRAEFQQNPDFPLFP
jgi:hypothetical protein